MGAGSGVTRDWSANGSQILRLQLNGSKRSAFDKLEPSIAVIVDKLEPSIAVIVDLHKPLNGSPTSKDVLGR